MKYIINIISQVKIYLYSRHFVYLIFSIVVDLVLSNNLDKFIFLYIFTEAIDAYAQKVVRERIGKLIDKKIIEKQPNIKDALKIINETAEREVDEDLIADIVSDHFIKNVRREIETVSKDK